MPLVTGETLRHTEQPLALDLRSGDPDVLALMRTFEGFGRWQSECLASVCDLAATGPIRASRMGMEAPLRCKKPIQLYQSCDVGKCRLRMG